MPDTIETALRIIDDLAGAAGQNARFVELSVMRILRAVGYAARMPDGPEDSGRDLLFDAEVEGRHESVALQVKAHRGPVSGQSIYHAMDTMLPGDLDRLIVVSTGNFTNLAQSRADTTRLGKVDLLDLEGLRNWVRRFESSAEEGPQSVRHWMKGVFREMALRIARHPEQLAKVEWRELENMLSEVFGGLGFDSVVTRSAQDGGYDVRLKDEFGHVYLVEIKHWAERVVGQAALRKLMEVTVREEAKAGLLLSSSGYTANIFDGLIELAPVHMGAEQKIVSLCRAFYRAETEVWLPDTRLAELLLQDTIPARPPLVI